mmetsp:Transcript_2680/g.5222  ORF Transcript_2680/g.5222 Transcript_2680/m.5222 type:complete len:344 (+) Transcript_2680:234-1265(+)
MRKGMIRPRTFASPPDEDDKEYKYRHNANAKSKNVWIVMFVLALLMLGVVTRLAAGTMEHGSAVEIASSKAHAPARHVRGGLEEEGEDDDEDLDSEDDEGDDDQQHVQTEGDDDDENENDDDDDDDADHQGEEEDDEGNDSFHDEDEDNHDGEEEHDGEEASHEEEQVEREDEVHQAANTEVHLEKLSEESDKPKMSIETYFSNLGKKTVNISPSGSYKYVLVHAKDFQDEGAYIVQGCPSKSKTCKHPDAARTARTPLATHGLSSRVLGGGRVTRHHLRKSKKAGLISIFGYSRTYGRCTDCNKIACQLVAHAYPEYVVRWSNAGYLESDERAISDWIKCSV